MNDPRRDIMEWAREGRIAPGGLRRALLVGGVLPDARGWRLFADRLLLWLGTVMVAAGVIFFLAYNWRDLGRFAKFGLVEILIAGALVAVWSLGLERVTGKAALLGAALLAGAFAALYAQTYQTGADTYELFGAWALAILPWALAGRLAPLWVLWLALVNLSLILYYRTFRGIFWWPGEREQLLWWLLALNTAALVVWEVLGARLAWLRDRWGARVVATVSGGLATALAVLYVTDTADHGAWGVVAWMGWLAGAGAVYRRRVKDVYVLTGGVLSIIVVVTSLLGKHLPGADDAFGLLVTGLAVVAMSAAGGWWLRKVAAEEEP